jgi:hypothetical protein
MITIATAMYAITVNSPATPINWMLIMTVSVTFVILKLVVVVVVLTYANWSAYYRIILLN